jgi:hypothetical protein
MRTTLTIDDDIAQALRNLSHERKSSFRSVVNEVLRRGLMTGQKPPPLPEPFRVKSAPRGFRPGIDLVKLNLLVNEIEVEDFLAQDHRFPSDS